MHTYSCVLIMGSINHDNSNPDSWFTLHHFEHSLIQSYLHTFLTQTPNHWFIGCIHSIPLRKNIGYSFCDRLDHDSICILHDDDWMRSTTYSHRIKGWIRLSKKQIMIMNSNWIVIQVWLDILPSFLLDLYRYILVYFDWIWIIIWNSYFWHSTSFRIGWSWSWTLLYSRIHIGSIHLDLYPTSYIIHHTSYIIQFFEIWMLW